MRKRSFRLRCFRRMLLGSLIALPVSMFMFWQPWLAIMLGVFLWLSWWAGGWLLREE